jgi:hypothetical protein
MSSLLVNLNLLPSLQQRIKTADKNDQDRCSAGCLAAVGTVAVPVGNTIVMTAVICLVRCEDERLNFHGIQRDFKIRSVIFHCDRSCDFLQSFRGWSFYQLVGTQCGFRQLGDVEESEEALQVAKMNCEGFAYPGCLRPSPLWLPLIKCRLHLFPKCVPISGCNCLSRVPGSRFGR